MPPTAPLLYQSPQHPLLHSGIVRVTGSLEVDLGIKHDNYIVSPIIYSNLAADANISPTLTWKKVPNKPGVFKLTTWKVTTGGGGGNPTLIAATAAVDVSFLVIAGASVS